MALRRQAARSPPSVPGVPVTSRTAPVQPPRGSPAAAGQAGGPSAGLTVPLLPRTGDGREHRRGAGRVDQDRASNGQHRSRAGQPARRVARPGRGDCPRPASARRVKPRHLLIALALARGVPVSKERLVWILWGDERPAASMATLESYVCVLRKHLQVPGAARQGTIMTRAGCYSLDLDQVDLDVAALARDVGRALHPSVRPELALPLLRRTLAVARTPLLPDEASALRLDAARAEHERMTSEWLVAAAEKVVDIAPGDATRWARQAIEADPLDEGAWYAYLHSKDVSGTMPRGSGVCQVPQGIRRRARVCTRAAAAGDVRAVARGPATTDPELEGLIEAVVRLHRVSRGGYADGDAPDSGPASGPPVGARLPTRPDARSPPSCGARPRRRHDRSVRPAHDAPKLRATALSGSHTAPARSAGAARSHPAPHALTGSAQDRVGDTNNNSQGRCAMKRSTSKSPGGFAPGSSTWTLVGPRTARGHNRSRPVSGGWRRAWPSSCPSPWSCRSPSRPRRPLPHPLATGSS